MNTIELGIKGVVVVEMPVFSDERGSFQEIWNTASMSIPGLTGPFVQDNIAFSRHGVLRGLHCQMPFAQAKLVVALQGEVFCVAVDLRLDSPTFGQWTSYTLAGDTGKVLFLPAGFALGYQVLSQTAHVFYKCSEVYHREAEHALAWNDPELNIPWPIPEPIVSARDSAALPLHKIRDFMLRRLEARG